MILEYSNALILATNDLEATEPEKLLGNVSEIA